MMRCSDELTLLASGVQDTTGDGGGTILDVGAYDELLVFLHQTAKTGSPTSLDVKIEFSPDKTNWFSKKTSDAFTQVTSASATHECIPVAVCGRYVRAYQTITNNGGSYTYAVTCIGKANS